MRRSNTMFVTAGTLVSAACMAIVAAIAPLETKYGTVLAQDSCPRYTSTGGGLTEISGFLGLSDGSCALDSIGGYVKIGSYIRLDAYAAVDGHCTVKVLSGWPPVCTPAYEQDRTVNKVEITEYPPSALPTKHNLFAKDENGLTVFRQTLDSRAAGTTSPPPVRFPNELGQYLYTFQSIINKTNCNIEPGQSDLFQAPVIMTTCEPTFLISDGIFVRYFDEPLIVTFPPHWNGDEDDDGWPEQALNSHMTHELGHTLGLGDYVMCDSDNSIMAAGPCDSESVNTVPSAVNDVMPILQTTYGNMNFRKTCGYPSPPPLEAQ